MEPLGREVRAELARYGPQAGMAELVERWPGAVGVAIARNAWPLRISRDGTVQVATADSVWAFELGQRAAEIAARLEVPGLRFAPGPLPEPDRDPPPRGVAASEEDERRAAEIAAVVVDEKVRKAVQKAISLGLARARIDRPI